MSKPVTRTWIGNNAQTFSAIASPQTQGQLINGYMVLNSNMTTNQAATSDILLTGPHHIAETVRQIQINTPSGANAGLSFFITGIGCPEAQLDTNGNPLGPVNQVISETITNVTPGAGTQRSVNIYKQVNSILVSGGNITGTVAVGYGTKGITDPFMCDYNRIDWYATLQAQFYNGGFLNVLNYVLYFSVTEPYEAKYPNPGQWSYFPEPPGIDVTLLNSLNTAFSGTYGQTSQLGEIPSPVTMIWANCDDGGYAIDDTLYLTFTQQGIRS